MLRSVQGAERVEPPAGTARGTGAGHAEPEPWARRATASQPRGLASRLGAQGTMTRLLRGAGHPAPPPECAVSQDPAAAPWAGLTPESPVSTGGLVPWSCPASWRPPPTRPDRLSAHPSPAFRFSISELLGSCPSHHVSAPWSSQACVSSGAADLGRLREQHLLQRSPVWLGYSGWFSRAALFAFIKNLKVRLCAWLRETLLGYTLHRCSSDTFLMAENRSLSLIRLILIYSQVFSY